MADALTLSQELRAIEDRYLEMADDKPAFAEQMLLRWQEQVSVLAWVADRARYRRTPSGMLRVETPTAPKPDPVDEILDDLNKPERP